MGDFPLSKNKKPASARKGFGDCLATPLPFSSIRRIQAGSFASPPFGRFALWRNIFFLILFIDIFKEKLEIFTITQVQKPKVHGSRLESNEIERFEDIQPNPIGADLGINIFRRL
jgi:hypothetical protein